jgi:hypothetical protein
MVNRFLSNLGIRLDNFGAKPLRKHALKTRMVGPGVVTHANPVNGLRVKQRQEAPWNANGFLGKCQNTCRSEWAHFRGITDAL